MTKVTQAPGFVSAEVKRMPKNVRYLNEAPDGAYLTVAAVTAQRSNSGNNYNARKALPSGSLIIVTEGGHLYTLSSHGFVGLGKNNRNAYSYMMVQRVNIAVTVSDFRAAPKKSKKTKVVKKKKKRMTKKRRA